MAYRVTEIMTKGPVVVPLELMLIEAAKLMRDHAIGDVLVTSNGHLCGVLTDRDIVVRAVAESRDLRRTTVGEVCSADIATVGPDANIDDAVAVMRSRAVRRVPVVENGAPIGILTMGDLAVRQNGNSALAEITKAPPSR
ncbi:MAG TPA: CBS domain-containing protein [Streptosporangiaceae bacterium]